MGFGTPPSADDARRALVEALVATGDQDRDAFVRVYRMTAAKLFGICLRICGDRHAAEEVLQDVYALVWKRAGGFEPGRASPITWLAMIARNRAIDWRRANPLRETAGVEEAADLPAPSPSAYDAMLFDETDRRLHLCLDRLQDVQRDTIRAAFFGGFTYAELAQQRDVPLGTVKSWIRRGLGRLRDCLDDGD
ncbi:MULTISPECIES: sigma-70 family RNA polymerase sigma factor [unclassified Sphingomonas]|jgi:RNA polymerase sigma factor (sigma-70 family)|nr:MULTISPECIES: sigma-70 family RNA polymerase sigma factor [unclassified Sphingomonas]AXJ95057.1 RNA polymerase subunit sigma [Sphingomonas sp. FARSPH]